MASPSTTNNHQAKVSTVDQEAEKHKSRRTVTLTDDSLDTLNKMYDRAKQALASNDMFEVYAGFKAATNYIERIARDNSFQPSNLGTFSLANGVIHIVQDRERRKWGTAKKENGNNSNSSKRKRKSRKSSKT